MSFRKILVFTIVTLLLVTGVFATPTIVPGGDEIQGGETGSVTLLATGECGDNLTWILDRAGTLTIGGDGEMTSWAWSPEAVVWYSYRFDIKNVVIEDGVTSIGDYAFGYCENLESVKIGAGVTSIGNQAFMECESLGSIVIPDKVTSIGKQVFWGCISLTDITIGSGLTTLTESLFESCEALESVVIPGTVKTIDKYAFSGCTNLKDVKISYGVETIENRAFAYSDYLKNVEIPDSVIRLGENVFNSSLSLERIIIPSSIETFGENVFSYCPKLTVYGYADSAVQAYATENNVPFVEIIRHGSCGENLRTYIESTGKAVIYGSGEMYTYNNYPNVSPWKGYDGVTSVVFEDGVTNISPFSFYSCANLRSIIMTDSVTSIGEKAFSDCDGLESVEFSDNITSIGDYAFYRTWSLKELVLPDKLESFGEGAFSNSGVESVVIPSSLTEFDNGVFDNCGSLKTITVDEDNEAFSTDENGVLFNKNKTELIYYPLGKEAEYYTVPDGVVTIATGAFSKEEDLKNVAFPQSLRSIGDYAFWNCSNFETITLPYGLETIGTRAFSYCWGETIVIPETVKSIAQFAFESTSAMRGSQVNNAHTISDCLIEVSTGTEGDYVISSGTRLLADLSFYNCNKITSITIPDSVEYIGQEAFENCHALAAFYVSENNEYFSTDENGVLYNKDKTEIIMYPPANTAETFKVPSGVTELSYISLGVKLKIVVLPEGVTSISDMVFENCPDVTIRGYAGSYAQTYAEAKGIAFEVIPEISFSTSMQAFLNLEGLISMSVGYKFNDMDSIDPEDYLEKVGLLVWNADKAPEEQDATFENCTNVIAGAVYKADSGRFETTTEGIVAKKLGDQLCFRAYYLNDDGTYSYSKYVKNYSPKTYCYNRIEKNPDNEATVELMASILNYGAAAQKYFGYKTEDLMNKDLPEELQ